MVIKKELVFPIFLTCLTFCENIFWTSIFEDLAYGKCPPGTYIHKDYFCCSYKNKEFSYKIENNKDGKLLYDDVYFLLSKKIKILSDEDRKNQLLDFIKVENEINEIKYDKWSSIKKKSTKDSLIENFIIDIKKRYNLTDKQTKQLQYQINIGLTFKTISHKDIVLKEGKIDKILPIEFYQGGFNVTKDLIKSEDVECTAEVSNDTFKLSDLWKKTFFNVTKEEVNE